MSSEVNTHSAVQRQNEGGSSPMSMQQGCVQRCECYLSRQSKILKRWKMEWLKLEPGKGLD